MLSRAALVVPFVAFLALSTGACGVPVAVTASSYAADGGLALTTSKTTADHFISMVSKQDCSMWRVFRHQVICKERADGKDPYDVNYNEPFRSPSEGGGVQYGPPLHAAADAPAMSWDAAAYKSTTPAPSEPATAVADSGVAPAVAATSPSAPAGTDTAPVPVAEASTPQTSAPEPSAAHAAPARTAASNHAIPKRKRIAHRNARKPSPSRVASAH